MMLSTHTNEYSNICSSNYLVKSLSSWASLRSIVWSIRFFKRNCSKKFKKTKGLWSSSFMMDLTCNTNNQISRLASYILTTTSNTTLQSRCGPHAKIFVQANYSRIKLLRKYKSKGNMRSAPNLKLISTIRPLLTKFLSKFCLQFYLGNIKNKFRGLFSRGSSSSAITWPCHLMLWRKILI